MNRKFYGNGHNQVTSVVESAPFEEGTSVQTEDLGYAVVTKVFRLSPRR